MEQRSVIILAGGRGKRMLSDEPKVLSRSRDGTLISCVLSAVKPLSVAKTVVVAGYKHELVSAHLKELNSTAEVAIQKEQLGTGDAAKAALSALTNFTGAVAILYGDVPLLKTETIEKLFALHEEQKATITILTFVPPTATGYGRIVRNDKGAVTKIVEEKDCSPEEKLLKECNSGIYIVESSFLPHALNQLTNDNAQKEYYLTDIVSRAAKEGQTICTFSIVDNNEVMGVNTKKELAQISEIQRLRVIDSLLDKGVNILSPHTTFIDGTVTIAPGATIGPNVTIKGASIIEEGVVIEGSAYLIDTIVRKNSLLRFSVRAEKSVIGENCAVGPFAHLRPESDLGDSVHIGNFVETKKAKLHAGAKANHLTYLGDCEVGEKTNIGAGTITCNYDGYNKQKTTIGKDCFIGSDSCLIAPVTIHDGSYVGAGSVISKDVPADALAFTRAELTVKEGWAKNKRAKGKK